jgi:hypothetical protein
MNRPLSDQKQKLFNLPLSQLVETAGRLLGPPDEPAPRQRVFTPWVTFWLFLFQVLDASRTCREAVRHAQAWWAIQQDATLSSNTSAYCQARTRLPQAHLDHALEAVTQHLRQHEAPMLAGRPVKVVDGSTCSMPDTYANQACYPQHKNQKPGCGFPVMHLAVVFSLATGAILGVARGNLHDNERTLWRRLWDRLQSADIVLADRGFCAFADFCLLLQRGVDSIMRLHACRTTGVKTVRQLGKGDWLVEWAKGHRPNWMEKAQWAALPNTLRVRHIEVRITVPGFRPETIIIATTLLDPKRYPAKAIIALYRKRWDAELYLRDIKITMGMDKLRCKTPTLICKELTMHLIAYNLVRAIMLQAARQHRRDPLRISLAGTAAAIRSYAPAFMSVRSKRARNSLLDSFMRAIASDIVPFRPDRVEPRAQKTRPKDYPFLSRPRHQFKNKNTPH